MLSNMCWKLGLYCCNLVLESFSIVFKYDFCLYVWEVGEGIILNFEQNLKFEYCCLGCVQLYLVDVDNICF